MENQNSFNQFVNDATQVRNYSKHLFRIHELAVHQLNPDEITETEQSCFYFLYSTAKAIKKIEKKAIKKGVPVTEIESSKLIELIKSDSGQLSESLVISHNLVCHRLHLMHFTEKVQNSLYFVSEVVKHIKAIENQLKAE